MSLRESLGRIVTDKIQLDETVHNVQFVDRSFGFHLLRCRWWFAYHTRSSTEYITPAGLLSQVMLSTVGLLFHRFKVLNESKWVENKKPNYRRVIGFLLSCRRSLLTLLHFVIAPNHKVVP